MATLTHPDRLNNSIIQRMGELHISINRKYNTDRLLRIFNSFKRDTIPVALKLKNYAEESDVYSKWKFIAGCFAELDTTSSLAQVIYHTFSTTFNSDKIKPFQLINKSKKHDASIDLDRIPSSAEEAYSLQLLVDDFYVNKLHDEAARLNPHFDADHNKSPLLKDNPTAITNATLYKLSRIYFDNVKKKSNYKLFDDVSAANQAVAIRLKTYYAETDSFHKWLMLVECYASLPKSKGPLADGILDLFYIAFGRGVCTRLNNYDFKREDISPHTIATALRGIVSQWYAAQYHETIQLHKIMRSRLEKLI